MRISDWSSDVCSSDLHGSSLQILARGAFCQQEKQQADDSHRQQVRQQDRPDVSGQKDGFQRSDEIARRDQPGDGPDRRGPRSEEQTSELQSLMRISYAGFCLKKTRKKTKKN